MSGMTKARKSARATQRVTIDEVARQAGVSPMTVSRVVNGGKYVRDDTRETVMAAVRKLNYMPNPAARTVAGAGGGSNGPLYWNAHAAFFNEVFFCAVGER